MFYHNLESGINLGSFDHMMISQLTIMEYCIKTGIGMSTKGVAINVKLSLFFALFIGRKEGFNCSVFHYKAALQLINTVSLLMTVNSYL